ncbi:hypothetical protein SLS60_001126 [Paraconiothyrium brasiliense]|uniref:Uncharacterized protein n=1 Tax=Paraconiothyrium brasiliense TaxID=300254 RepID=A0ABR3S870_9PLEO
MHSHSSQADHNPSNHSQRGNNRDRRQIAGMRALADHINTPNSRLYWVLEGLEEYITAYEQDPNFDIRDRLQKLHPGLKTEILYYRTADIANQYRGLMQRYDNIARIYNPQHRPTQLPMAPKVR